MQSISIDLVNLAVQLNDIAIDKRMKVHEELDILFDTFTKQNLTQLERSLRLKKAVHLIMDAARIISEEVENEAYGE